MSRPTQPRLSAHLHAEPHLRSTSRSVCSYWSMRSLGRFKVNAAFYPLLTCATQSRHRSGTVRTSYSWPTTGLRDVDSWTLALHSSASKLATWGAMAAGLPLSKPRPCLPLLARALSTSLVPTPRPGRAGRTTDRHHSASPTLTTFQLSVGCLNLVI